MVVGCCFKCQDMINPYSINPVFGCCDPNQYWLVMWNILYLYIYILGISSSQLTNSIIFQSGRYTTNQNTYATCLIYHIMFGTLNNVTRLICYGVLTSSHKGSERRLGCSSKQPWFEFSNKRGDLR